MCRREDRVRTDALPLFIVANDLSAYRPPGINVSNPIIQSVYCCKVRVSASGSACAENVARDSQYSLHPSYPFPASQASKKFLAIPVMAVIGRPPSTNGENTIRVGHHASRSVTSADCAGDSSRNPKPEASKPPRAGRLDGGEQHEHPKWL
jgi:hypothetical protein